jgi:uncharacterized protein YdeI (BOF family)
MKRFLLVAAVAAIALTGLSANQCTGSSDQTQQQPPADQQQQQQPPQQPPQQ